MKTNQKPFDDKKVREAVNHAINKARIVKLINGRAVVANQVLPPGMPGYDTVLQGLPDYDPKKAKELLKEAGHADGFSTTLFANNTDPNPRIAEAIQQDLAAVGIKAELKTLAQENVIAAAGSDRCEAPLVWSGGMAWEPTTSRTRPTSTTPILSIAAVPGPRVAGTGPGHCNQAIESRAKAADALVKPSEAAQRIALWSKIFTDVMQDAPWVPVFDEKRYTVHQPSVKAASADIFVDPINIPVNYNMIYKSNA